MECPDPSLPTKVYPFTQSTAMSGSGLLNFHHDRRCPS
jgi:hypothetical protein